MIYLHAVKCKWYKETNLVSYYNDCNFSDYDLYRVVSLVLDLTGVRFKHTINALIDYI